jgi:2-polyprenyl-3-methyl-5-hydroxy-6-metoxy-1,4-benzoquinol methylase
MHHYPLEIQKRQNDAFWLKAEKCDYCGGAEYKGYMVSKVPNWYKGVPFKLVECVGCGLIFADPRPNPDVIYKDYLEGREKSAAATSRKLNRPNVLDGHLKAILHAKSFLNWKPLNLFDMGCGAGTILEAAKSIDINAEGNDINKFATDRLKALGFNVHHGFTQDLNVEADYFDIVINFDYLEHSYTPYKDLLKCCQMLKHGGVLYLKTLYLDCPDHLMKGESYQLFGSGHFHYFKSRVLCEMVKSAGFAIKEIRTGNLIFIIATKV